jgi:leucyl/phenylalanyl-tRNA--protein transferase
VQWGTPHLATLGVVEIPRSAYLRRLPGVLAVPAAPVFG